MVCRGASNIIWLSFSLGELLLILHLWQDRRKESEPRRGREAGVQGFGSRPVEALEALVFRV